VIAFFALTTYFPLLGREMPKDYLLLNLSEDTTPEFLFNYSVPLSEWQAAEVEPLPPACVPKQIQIASVLEVRSRSPLLNHAITMGVYLTVHHMQNIFSEYGWPKPSGTGKNYRVKRIDYLMAMIAHVFPDATIEEKAKFLAGMMNQGVGPPCPESVLKCLACLDIDNQAEFAAMAKDAQAQVKEIEKNNIRNEYAREIESRSSSIGLPIARRTSVTPKELKHLLPGGGAGDGLYLKHNSDKQVCQGFYPGLCLSDPNN
jgi:hypothetical protein